MGPNEVQYCKHASENREEFASTELRPACFRETHLAEGGNGTVYWSQSRGIPNDEIYKDDKYMQRIAEKVQKLATANGILEYDSPKDNILST